ncbi:MAG: Beta-barrel assembly-enhancing protease [Hyphomicrobiaceae bacterium hypho_1]
MFCVLQQKFRMANQNKNYLHHIFMLVALTTTVILAGNTRIVNARGLPLIRDTEIELLLNEYAQPIFKAAGLGGSRIAIKIVNSRVFNAFVVDGRNVFINTGTLMQSDTPNQIVGVIAHEAGHIAGGDLAALRARIKRDRTKLILLRILGVGAAIASGDGRAVTAGDSLVMHSLLAERRVQEASADQRALIYLSQTKQSGLGMLETFQRFQRQEYISDRQKDPFVRSHPVATERLALLRNRIRQSPYYDKRDSPSMQLRHDMMRAKLYGYLEQPSIVFNRYPKQNNTVPAKYARAIATFFQGGDKGLLNALSAVDELIKSKPKYPYFYELKADFLQRSGQPSKAARYLRKAIRLDPNSTLLKVRLGSVLLESAGKAAADEVIVLVSNAIQTDAKYENEQPKSYRVLGKAYYIKGNFPRSYAATAEAYFLEGNFKQARIFAQRAKPGIKKGSPIWWRMDEIEQFTSRS